MKIDDLIDQLYLHAKETPNKSYGLPEGQITEAEFKQSIKQLILERMERKSVEELEDKIPEAMTDLASKVCFKEGYNKAIDDVTKVINKLFDGRE